MLVYFYVHLHTFLYRWASYKLCQNMIYIAPCHVLGRRTRKTNNAPDFSFRFAKWWLLDTGFVVNESLKQQIPTNVRDFLSAIATGMFVLYNLLSIHVPKYFSRSRSGDCIYCRFPKNIRKTDRNLGAIWKQLVKTYERKVFFYFTPIVPVFLTSRLQKWHVCHLFC